MNAENKFFETRVVPFVRYETVVKNGRKKEIVIDNITSQECRNMSCESKMFVQNSEKIYEIVDTPLSMNSFTGIRGLLCFVFDDLNEVEQKKFYSRSIVIYTTTECLKEKETPTAFFGRKKTKRRM